MSEVIGQRHINISNDIIIKAKEKAKEMGELKNSITKGAGNVHGFLGEFIVSNYLNATIENTYDYDIKLGSVNIEVKTKRTTVAPRTHYECSIAEYNTKQNCDVYVFTRILKDMTRGWILGYISKKEYFDEATFLKKGQVDPSNGWTVNTNCYNLPISKLKNIETLHGDYNVRSDYAKTQ